MITQLLMCFLLGIFTLHSVAFAQTQPTTYDCGRMYSTTQRDSFTLPAALVEYCLQRGWDPPGKEYEGSKTNWQPLGGKPVRTGTAGSIQGGAKQPPDIPPGSSHGSSLSASGGILSHAAGRPSGSGSQCITFAGQSLCPRCSVTGGQNVCEVPVMNPTTGQVEYKPAGEIEGQAEALRPANPLSADISGEFGRITRMRGGREQLSCGGTMTMANAEVSAVSGATHLAIAALPNMEEDNYRSEIHVYERRGTAFLFKHTVRTAKNVCGVDEDKRARTTEQYLFFTPTQPKVAFRAIQPREEAQEQGGTEAVVYNTADEEKYILIRPQELINGRSNAPSCEEFKRYPKNIPDLRIMPPEASEDVTMELPLNTESCPNRSLHLELSTPNLVHQPEAIVDMFDIQGGPLQIGNKATLSTAGSALYYQPETLLRIGAPGRFILSGDAIIELPNLKTLHIYGPATINGGASPGITLNRGGHIEDVEGEIIERIPPTANYNPSDRITAPYYIISHEKTYLPAGLMMLSKPGGFIREPVAPPAEE